MCVYAGKIGKQKKRRRQRKEEESLLGRRKKVSLVWVCISGLTFYSKDKLFMKACDKLRLQF